MNRGLVCAFALGLTAACADNEEPAVPDGRGLITALINMDLTGLDSLLIVPVGAGDSVVFLQVTGIFRAEGVNYGVTNESRLFGIALDDRLQLRWVQDYGIASAVGLLGGARVGTTLEVLIATGSFAGVEAPAVFSIALGDGALGSSAPLTDPEGDVTPASFSASEAGVALAGAVTTTDGTRGWLARYGGTLLAPPGYRQSFERNGTASSLESIAIDAGGDLYVQGTAEDTYIFRLSPGAEEEVLWERSVSAEASGQPLAVTPSGDLALTSAAVDPAEVLSPRPRLVQLVQEDGTDGRQIEFADESADPVVPLRLCTGPDSVTLIGEFAGTLRTEQTVATVANRSLFFYKTSGEASEPIFLRWSSSSVDISVVGTGCEPEGSVLAAGTFPSVEGLGTGLFILRLSD